MLRLEGVSGRASSGWLRGTCTGYIQFAARLIQACVPTELHVYPGAYHASEVFAPEAALSQSILARRTEALLRALKS